MDAGLDKECPLYILICRPIVKIVYPLYICLHAYQLQTSHIIYITAKNYLVKVSMGAAYCSFRVHCLWLNDPKHTYHSCINLQRHLSACQCIQVHMHPFAGYYLLHITVKNGCIWTWLLSTAYHCKKVEVDLTTKSHLRCSLGSSRWGNPPPFTMV